MDRLQRIGISSSAMHMMRSCSLAPNSLFVLPVIVEAMAGMEIKRILRSSGSSDRIMRLISVAAQKTVAPQSPNFPQLDSNLLTSDQWVMRWWEKCEKSEKTECTAPLSLSWSATQLDSKESVLNKQEIPNTSKVSWTLPDRLKYLQSTKKNKDFKIARIFARSELQQCSLCS